MPIGNYSRQIFDKMGKDPAYGADFGTKALANLVSEEANVRQVVSKVQLGEGDAGIVYASDVTPAVRAQLKIITIPMPLNIVAEYPVAAVKGGANVAGANAFIAYLLSTEGQSILQKWGFIPVSSGGCQHSSDRRILAYQHNCRSILAWVYREAADSALDDPSRRGR